MPAGLSAKPLLYLIHFYKHLIPNLSMVFSLFTKIPETVKGLFKKDPVLIRMRLEDAPLFIEKEFLIKKNKLEDFAGRKISEIKYLHSKSANLLKAISEKELKGKENGRFNKAALTSKKQLETQLKRLIEKIDPKERLWTKQDTIPAKAIQCFLEK